MLSSPQSPSNWLNGKMALLDLNIWDVLAFKDHQSITEFFCVLCLVEWNGGAFSCPDAFTETPLSFQESRELLHSSGSGGLAARAPEEQSELWARGHSQANSPAAKKIPEESRYWRRQGKMGSGGFWRQPAPLQVMAACERCWTVGRLSASAQHLETSWSGRIYCVHWSDDSVCNVLSA